MDWGKSYFVLFKDGGFITLAGNPPKDFYNPFEQYEEQKKTNSEQLGMIVP